MTGPIDSLFGVLNSSDEVWDDKVEAFDQTVTGRVMGWLGAAKSVVSGYRQSERLCSSEFNQLADRPFDLYVTRLARFNLRAALFAEAEYRPIVTAVSEASQGRVLVRDPLESLVVLKCHEIGPIVVSSTAPPVSLGSFVSFPLNNTPLFVSRVGTAKLNYFSVRFGQPLVDLTPPSGD